MNVPFAWFVKLSGLPIEHFYFKKKVYFEDKLDTSNKIKGAALIVSNHTSIYDFPLMMYTFFNRNLRTLIAEVMYQQNIFLTTLLTRLGAIKVDRKSYDFTFMSEMIDVLKKNHVGLVFPESRLPTKDDKEGELLEFKPSYIYLALQSGVPIIPVYTNGIYGKLKKKKKDRARLIIGKKIYVNDLYDENKSEKENISYINDYIKNKIYSLKLLLDERISCEKEG